MDSPLFCKKAALAAADVDDGDGDGDDAAWSADMVLDGCCCCCCADLCWGLVYGGGGLEP